MFRRKCKTCSEGINIVNNAKCGYPECSTLAIMAFLFETGVVYACLDHFEELVKKIMKERYYTTLHNKS